MTIYFTIETEIPYDDDHTIFITKATFEIDLLRHDKYCGGGQCPDEPEWFEIVGARPLNVETTDSETGEVFELSPAGERIALLKAFQWFSENQDNYDDAINEKALYVQSI